MVNAETGKRMTPEEIGEYVANAVRARPECDDFLFISALVDGVPKDVCHIGNGEAGPYNALLMAASHDLYEALAGYVHMMAVGGGNDPEAIKKAIRQADDAARAALAKARGEPCDTAG